MMDAENILARVREGNDLPEEWVILPLIRNKLILGMVGWASGTILGLGLFALMLPLVVPYNFTHGTAGAIVTTIFLAVLLFIGLGSAWSLLTDILRLQHLNEYTIVITPQDFIKQDRSKIIQIPMAYVRHVTARGTPPPDRTVPTESGVRQVPSMGENITGMFFGRGVAPSGQRWRRGRMRTPTTLAFVDARTEDEILVVNDSSYGDPFMIAAILKQYAATARDMVP